MISWRDGDGEVRRGSLFAAFAALSRGEAWSFPALRPHQREPWHAFTVQVAALALIRAGLDEPPTDEVAWRDLLLALTPDHPGGEAWELVVDDWSKPALLQPPVVTAARRSEYKTALLTPDAFDVLVTSKNHDLKQERMAEASEEDWLFALITLQTASAYGGAKTYGASRMNGKTGSRLMVRVRPRGGAGAAFQRDVRLLASSAQGEGERKALLWLEPNDGEVPLPHHTLAPSLYVDCARRVRLLRQNGRVEARYATAEKARVNADAYAGKTGDPYAPIKPEGDASVTPKRRTFGYRGISELFAAPLPLMAKCHTTDDPQGLRVSFSALVRRGGTDTNTDGFFERVIPTSRVEELYEYGPEVIFDRVGKAARVRTDEAGEARQRLRRALISLFQGGPDQPRWTDDAAGKKADPWTQRFDVTVDRDFFDDELWAEAAGKAVAPRRMWRERLRVIAGEVFAQAAEAAPRTEMRRIRAVARSRSMLDAELRKWLGGVADGE